ncbi:glycolipid 2-alpha-mannosyltransferase [Nannochloropsis oceanica]
MVPRAGGRSLGSSGPEAGGGLLLSRRAIQIYAFLFINTLIFVMRSQWIVSMPSSLDTSVSSRHDATPSKSDRNGGPEGMGELQMAFERAQREGTISGSKGRTPHDSLRRGKESSTNSRKLDKDGATSVVVGHEGQLGQQQQYHDAFSHFLPKDQEVLESIYARGRARIQKELQRRHNNLSSIEPFNPWGPVYIWDWFSPDYNCPTMERIGRVGDGGKWICGVDVLKEREKCVVYSYGVNKDLSFELELIGRTGCEVHGFDPTVGGVPPDCKGNEHITFHKQALGPVSGPSDVFMMMETLLDTMKRQGHTFLDVLKVDIEGSEWDTFKAMLPEKALPFGQLLIELHFRDVVEVFEFFENMDTHGFRIFMRETNHNPCAAGKLPIAVEFSLINPQAYFGGVPQPAAVQAIAARPNPPTYNGVVYVLSHKGNLGRLSTMLSTFEKNFNRHYHYPVVIFHEDFGPAEKKLLKGSVKEMRLQFRQVGFSVPAWLDKAKIPERTPCSPHSSTVGYRHMNRFLAFYAAEELSKEYEWQWRLDDDSLITEEVGYDVFRLMAENGKKYGFTNIVQDDAKCVLGLWNATREYVDREGLEPTFFTRWTEGAVFYNNFEVSHRSIWTSAAYRKFFDYIDKLGGIYYHRWGDAPIRSIGVSLFVNESEVHQFTDVAYTHLPFISRNASGLPSPGQTLFSRAGGSNHHGDCNGNSTLAGHGLGGVVGHVHGGNNGTCYSGRPSGVVYTVLNDEPGQLEKLLMTLKSLDLFFTDHFHYPVAIFAADLSFERRTTIRKATRSVVEFHDLSFLASQPLPGWVVEASVPAFVDCGFGDDSIGDRKRNRYMASTGVRKLAAQYDYLWRLAPGAVLTENVTSDPFATLASGGKSFGYLMTVTDDSKCVVGLQEATKEYVQREEVTPTFLDVLPPGAVFYDGFAIAHGSFWRSPEYQSYFQFLDEEGGIFYHRWTEANILTQALALFMPTEEIHRFSDVGFEHAPFVKQSTNRAVLKKQLDSVWKDRSIAATPAPELSALLAPRRFGFLGSDVATSFRLPSVAGYGAYMWLLGDTFLGTSDGSRREGMHSTISNALAFLPSGADLGVESGELLSPSDVTFFWGYDDQGLPTAPFERTAGQESGTVLWPVSGVSVEYGGMAKIVLFAQRVRKTHELAKFLGVADAMNFEVEGTSIIIVENPAATPSRWKYRVSDLPGTDASHNWFSAVAVEGGKEVVDREEDVVYMVGNVGTRGLGVYDDEASKNVLARISIKELLEEEWGRMEVLVEDGVWARTTEAEATRPERRKTIFSPANAETTLQYNMELRAWVTLAVDGVTAQLVLWTARELTGPWMSTVIHNIPAPFDDLTVYKCYAGKGHPELAEPAEPGQGVELVFSYVCNSPSDSSLLFEEGMGELYAPQFVRVRLGVAEKGRDAI